MDEKFKESFKNQNPITNIILQAEHVCRYVLLKSLQVQSNIYFNNNENEPISGLEHQFYISRTFKAFQGAHKPFKTSNALSNTYTSKEMHSWMAKMQVPNATNAE